MKHSNSKMPTFNYAQQASTAISLEVANADNPFLADNLLTHGYKTTDLVDTVGFIDTLYLLICGEFPSAQQRTLLDKLAVCLANLGPRHPAVRAAMLAGVSKSDSANLLPLGLTVLSGIAHEVEKSMLFLLAQQNACSSQIVATLPAEGELYDAIPGFGRSFGQADPLLADYAQRLAAAASDTSALHWATGLVERLRPYRIGWLHSGLAAATFVDLGIPPREAIALFQLLCAPGILAHGLEQTHHPITAMPMLSDQNYHEQESSTP